jgi:hypothetical protein
MQIEIAWYEISGEEPRAMMDFFIVRDGQSQQPRG